jgi:hypothetical protein
MRRLGTLGLTLVLSPVVSFRSLETSVCWRRLPVLFNERLQQLKREARQMEIQNKIDKIMQLRTKGLNYNGEQATEEQMERVDKMSAKMWEAEMNQAEQLFGTQKRPDSTIETLDSSSGTTVVVTPSSTPTTTIEANSRRESDIRRKIEELKELKVRGLNYNTVKPEVGSATSQLSGAFQNEGENSTEAAWKALLGIENPTTLESGVESELFSSSRSDLSAESSSERRRSSVGGTWSAPSVDGDGIEMRRPSSSGSWGIFERPASISEGSLSLFISHLLKFTR